MSDGIQLAAVLAVLAFSGWSLVRAARTRTVRRPGRAPISLDSNARSFWQSLAFEAAIFILFTILLIRLAG